jgi:hypothetical protein
MTRRPRNGDGSSLAGWPSLPIARTRSNEQQSAVRSSRTACSSHGGDGFLYLINHSNGKEFRKNHNFSPKSVIGSDGILAELNIKD